MSQKRFLASMLAVSTTGGYVFSQQQQKQALPTLPRLSLLSRADCESSSSSSHSYRSSSVSAALHKPKSHTPSSSSKLLVYNSLAGYQTAAAITTSLPSAPLSPSAPASVLSIHTPSPSPAACDTSGCYDLSPSTSISVSTYSSISSSSGLGDFSSSSSSSSSGLAPSAPRLLPSDRLNQYLKEPVMLFMKSWCPECREMESLLDQLGIRYTSLVVDEDPDGQAILNIITRRFNHRAVPMVFIGGQLIGGLPELELLIKTRELRVKLEASELALDDACRRIATSVGEYYTCCPT